MWRRVPTAAAQTETLDPLILSAKIVEPGCRCGCCCDLREVPENIGCLFGDDIILDGNVKKLYVTLGQFSIIRLERDIQLLMPAYDICMPAKECNCSGPNCRQEDPCDMFERFEFPVEEFFPPRRGSADDDRRDRKGGGGFYRDCGNGCDCCRQEREDDCDCRRPEHGGR